MKKIIAGFVALFCAASFFAETFEIDLNKVAGRVTFEKDYEWKNGVRTSKVWGYKAEIPIASALRGKTPKAGDKFHVTGVGAVSEDIENLRIWAVDATSDWKEIVTYDSRYLADSYDSGEPCKLDFTLTLDQDADGASGCRLFLQSDASGNLSTLNFAKVGITSTPSSSKSKIGTDYSMPSFDNKNAFVFDASLIKGKAVSKVLVINYTDYRGISFDVYVHNALTREWDKLGTQNLRAFGDRGYLGKNYKGLSNMRYFAIVPVDRDAQNEYLFNPIKKQKKVFNGALIIEARRPSDGLDMEPKPVLNEPNAYVMGESEIPDDSDENFSFINWSSTDAVSLRVFGYSKKDLRWVPLGAVAAKSGGVRRVLEMEQYDIDEFYYFGFAVNGKKKFAFSFKNTHDDICVTLTDEAD